MDQAVVADRSGAPPTVEIHLLGAFRVLRDGHEVTPTGLPGQLLRLVSLRGEPVHTDDLADALWPAATSDHGRRRIRNVLTRLREACGDVVERRGECLLLAPGVRVDLDAFEELADRAIAGLRDGVVGSARSAREALAMARAELLPEDRYAGWAADGRGRHARRVLELLDRLADTAAAAGDGREAVRLLLEAIDLEPYDEDRYVRAAVLLAADDRRGLAAHLLDLAGLMLDDLGVMPAASVHRLQRSLARPEVVDLDRDALRSW